MAEWTIETVRAQFPKWKIGWDYGAWQATHDDFDASWEGEEDGYVGNGLSTSANDLESLVLEIEAIEEEHNL